MKIRSFLIFYFSFFISNSWSHSYGDFIFKNTFEICPIDLSNIPSSEKFDVTCDVDLQGQSISLADAVILQRAGGSIFNGTLIMNNGAIDGELLNTSLTIEGDTSLISPIFAFHIERWDIMQNQVSQERAIKNKDEMNKVISLVKRLGANEFRLDRIDAYFYGDHFEINAVRSIEENTIKIPSDFTWAMSDNTFLRLQPSITNGKLLGVLRSNNVNITGGNLIGDRYNHDYSPVEDIFGHNRDTHEYSFLIHLAGAHNVVIDGVNMLDSSGDGLFVGSTGLRNPDGTLPPGVRQTQNVIIKNNLIQNNRRNNVSLVDGESITLENNIISDAGGGEQLTEEVQVFDDKGNPVYDEDGNPIFETRIIYSSAGTYPRSGIDMEAWRVRNQDTGELIEYERITEVIIKDNQFLNNEVSDLILFTTDNVLVENNFFSNGISATIAAYDIEIKDNTFENADVEFDPASIGIIVTARNVEATGEPLNYNFEIHGNMINGFDNGVILGGNNIEFYNNTVTDFNFGVRIGSIKVGMFMNNIYQSSRINSRGVWGLLDNSENTIFFNETIESQREPFILDRMNQSNSNSQVTFDSCTINSTGNFRARIANSSHISIVNNQLNREIELTGNNVDITIENNTINN